MRTRAGLAVSLAACLLAGLSPATVAADPQPAAVVVDAVPGVLLVTTRDAAGSAGLPALARRTVAGSSVRAIAARVAAVSVPAGAERSSAEALAAQPGVVAVERARYRRLLRAPDDPLYRHQWAHQLTQVSAAWDLTVGSADVTVAVLDNGVDARHPDLQPNVQAQRAFADGTSFAVAVGSDNRRCEPGQDLDHGTHVAGIVGARGGDGLGVAGVAWEVGLLDYAVFRSSADGACVASDADVLAALRTATGAGADVVNLSLGGFAPEQACGTAYQSVIDEARAAGVVVVAAAGNAQEDPATAGRPNVPASCNGVLSVAAVTADGEHAAYSSTNEHVDLAAPGGDLRTGFADGVLSTLGEGEHGRREGTSMAAPYVAGAAALLRSVAPELTPDQVEGLLEATAYDAGPEGRDPSYGWGVVDVGRAVELAVAGGRPEPAPDPVFPVGDSEEGGAQLPPPAGPSVYRVAEGSGQTTAVGQAVAMSQVAFPRRSAEHAVLARSDDFSDALAGSSLTLGHGPLLLAASAGPLPGETGAELLRALEPGSAVYLLGGPAALPSTLEDELRALDLVPTRLAGRTREETAVEVARQLAALRPGLGLPDPEAVVLTTGGNWPDAVAAGALGAAFGIPVLVTPTSALHPAPARLLRRLRPDQLIVVGGPQAVAEQTAEAAARAAGTGTSGTVRVAGSDRYATAVFMAQLLEARLAETGGRPGCVVVVNLVRPGGYAHALSANSLAGVHRCVLVPVQGASGEVLFELARSYVRRLGVDGVLAGDRDVISAAAAQDLRELLRP